MAISFTASPVVELQANSIVDRIMKRWGRKNKIKKLGKRALRMGKEIDLEAYSIKNGYNVIGMEPSWMLDDMYFMDHYFNLISTLVVGEYDINPSTGAPRSLESFYKHLKVKKRDKGSKIEMNIIKRADYYNAKGRILMHLTYSGDYGTPGEKSFWENQLLTSKEVSTTIGDTLTKYFLTLSNDYSIPFARTGVYVDLDFSKTDKNLNNFYEFLKNLRVQLDDNQDLYVAIPANLRKNYSYSLDIIKKIHEIADCIVIKATGFEKYQKNVPTTIFEKNNDYSVDGTLKKYLEDNQDESLKEKFAVMLPYYALKKSVNPNTKRLNYSYVTLDNMRTIIGKTGEIKYSKDTLFAKFKLDNEFYYLDDYKTLFYKYSYLIDTLGIKNVGLDALGYFNGEDRVPKMWGSIAMKYGKKRETLGWTIAAYLMAFIPIGFVFSLVKYWEVRNALAKYSKYFLRFVMFFVLFMFLFLTAANVVPRSTVGLIIGLIIVGIFALYILMKKVLIRSKKYVNIVK